MAATRHRPAQGKGSARYRRPSMLYHPIGQGCTRHSISAVNQNQPLKVKIVDRVKGILYVFLPTVFNLKAPATLAPRRYRLTKTGATADSSDEVLDLIAGFLISSDTEWIM